MAPASEAPIRDSIEFSTPLVTYPRWATVSIFLLTPFPWILKPLIRVALIIMIIVRVATNLDFFLFSLRLLTSFSEISFCSILSTVIYLGALGGLAFTDVVYIPYASVLGAFGILPVLYVITSRVK